MDSRNRTIYRGTTRSDACEWRVEVIEETTVNGEVTKRARKSLPPRNDLKNHSPDGFAWGYGGSGPSQLALAILADATGSDTLALGHYQRFKFDVIAKLDTDKSFELDADAVLVWLAKDIVASADAIPSGLLADVLEFGGQR